MTISVKENEKGYSSLFLKWDTGVMFDLPVGMIVVTPYRICAVGKFKCGGITTWNEVTKKAEAIDIADKITVASFNKKDSQYAKVTDYDRVICEKLESMDGKLIHLKMNSAMFPEGFGFYGNPPNVEAQKFALTIEESTTSDEHLKELQAVVPLLKTSTSKSGGSALTPEAQKALMETRLEFLRNNTASITDVIAELWSLLYYQDMLWIGAEKDTPPQVNLNSIITSTIEGIIK